jgi:hypothetical protein
MFTPQKVGNRGVERDGVQVEVAKGCGVEGRGNQPHFRRPDFEAGSGSVAIDHQAVLHTKIFD